jgi:hypothetical protein
VEGTDAIAAGVETVVELRQHQRRERHGPRLGDVARATDQPTREVQVECRQGDDGHDEAHETDAELHLGVDDAI